FPRVFIVQFTCFPYVFRKLIIHESSKPGNHYGRPVLLLLGLNATAPFFSIQYKSLFSLTAPIFFPQQQAAAKST
ncbi:MAG: hypothetical protein MR899_00370, partial [Clostridium sp.]|nr:hypothetical protein [Clostridium sp.]